jgi:hypothetical protein
MHEITATGTPVLIPPDSTRRKDTRPRWIGGACDFMRGVLSRPLGKARYRRRAQLIEPVFGDTKHNRGFSGFARRRRSATRTAWRLIAQPPTTCSSSTSTSTRCRGRFSLVGALSSSGDAGARR